MTDLLPWRTLSRRPVLDRPPWLSVWEEDVRLPDGRVIPGFLRVDLRDFAVVVARTAAGRVVVERCYKHGVGAVGVQFPAGYLEDGEDPAETAARELVEETGYGGGEWRLLGSTVADGNRGGSRCFTYLAEGVARVAEPDAALDLEETRVEEYTPDQVLAAVRDGAMTMAPMVAAVGLALVHGGL